MENLYWLKWSFSLKPRSLYWSNVVCFSQVFRTSFTSGYRKSHISQNSIPSSPKRTFQDYTVWPQRDARWGKRRWLVPTEQSQGQRVAGTLPSHPGHPFAFRTTDTSPILDYIQKRRTKRFHCRGEGAGAEHLIWSAGIYHVTPCEGKRNLFLT